MGANRILNGIAHFGISLIVALTVLLLAIICVQIAISPFEVVDNNYTDVGVPTPGTRGGWVYLLALFVFTGIQVLFYFITQYIWESKIFPYVYGLLHIMFFVLYALLSLLII